MFFSKNLKLHQQLKYQTVLDVTVPTNQYIFLMQLLIIVNWNLAYIKIVAHILQMNLSVLIKKGETVC